MACDQQRDRKCQESVDAVSRLKKMVRRLRQNGRSMVKLNKIEFELDRVRD